MPLSYLSSDMTMAGMPSSRSTGITNPMSGSAAMPAQPSPAESAKHKMEAVDPSMHGAANDLADAEMSQVQHDRQALEDDTKQQHAEIEKQKQDLNTSQYQQAMSNAQESMRKAEETRKKYEDALKNMPNTAEDAGKQLIASQAGTLARRDDEVKSVMKRMSGLNQKLRSSGTGQLAKMQMAGPTKIASQETALNRKPYGPKASIGGATPILSQRHSGQGIRYNPQGGSQPAPTPYPTSPVQSPISAPTNMPQAAPTTPAGPANYQRPAQRKHVSGIFSDGVAMDKHPETRKWVPLSQMPPEPVTTTAYQQPPVPRSQPVPSQAPAQQAAQQQQKAPQPQPTATPEEPAGPTGPTVMGMPLGKLKQVDPIFSFDDGSGNLERRWITDEMINSEDPEVASQARRWIAQNWVDKHRPGSENEAYDYILSISNDPELAHDVADEAFTIGEDELRMEELAQQRYDDEIRAPFPEAPWYRPDLQMRNAWDMANQYVERAGARAFDIPTGAGERRLEAARRIRPKHYGTKRDLKTRQENMTHQLNNMREQVSDDIQWAADAGIPSTDAYINTNELLDNNYDYGLRNAPSWFKPELDDNMLEGAYKNVIYDTPKALYGLMGNVADGGDHMRAGNWIGDTDAMKRQWNQENYLGALSNFGGVAGEVLGGAIRPAQAMPVGMAYNALTGGLHGLHVPNPKTTAGAIINGLVAGEGHGTRRDRIDAGLEDTYAVSPFGHSVDGNKEAPQQPTSQQQSLNYFKQLGEAERQQFIRDQVAKYRSNQPR